MDDPIDKAIAATEPTPIQVHRMEIPLPSTGRAAWIELPMDCTDDELFDVFAILATMGRATLKAGQARGPGLWVPQ